MTRQFAGKVALITGGGSGIGRATALAFVREGAKVVVADVAMSGEETVRMIKAAGGDANFVKADVSKADEVEAMVAKSVDTFGRLDYAHNNAGIDGDFTTIVKCSEENWDRVIGINLKGVWLGMKYEIPEILKQGGGAIVNTASVAAFVVSRTMGPYVATKHGVVGLTKVAALEYVKAGIRINAVCPGVIRTPLMEEFINNDPEAEAQMIAKEPIGRMGTPEEVANTVLWLCSDASSFVTGHALIVDGGMVVQSGNFPSVRD